MQIQQTLRQLGGLVVVEVPSEMLEEMGLKVGQEVLLTSEENTLRVESSIHQPSPDAVEFAARFTKKYEQAMRNLAQRWIGRPGQQKAGTLSRPGFRVA